MIRIAPGKTLNFMIVRAINTGWEIIQQQAHGLLAAQLAMQWRNTRRPIHWIETLTALLEHDDGQEPWEKDNHLTEAGAPLHFMITEYSVEQCQNLIAIGLEKSRWNALLLSHHTTFLYESKRGQDAELDNFLNQQTTNQQKWRDAYGATDAEVDYAYAFLQWCDALSLILCMNQLPPDERRLEISLGPDGKHYFISQRQADQTLSVDPWPFEAKQFTVHVEVYAVKQLHFKNDNELYKAINDTPVEQRTWTFCK